MIEVRNKRSLLVDDEHPTISCEKVQKIRD